MSKTPLRIERIGRVARLTLDRPDQLNALSAELVASLRDELVGITRDADVGAIVLTGEGRAFCAGADLQELRDFTPAEFDAYIRELEGVCRQLEQAPQPSIAAVHGVALGGGCELALACDLRVADPRARFGLPEIKLGVLPGAGGMQRAARLLPAGVVRKLALTGDPLSSSDALRFGLADLSDAGECADAALALAEQLASGPRLAQAAAKRLLRVGASLDAEAAIEMEQGSVTALFATEDRREGFDAFIEKREPRFSGR